MTKSTKQKNISEHVTKPKTKQQIQENQTKPNTKQNLPENATAIQRLRNRGNLRAAEETGS